MKKQNKFPMLLPAIVSFLLFAAFTVCTKLIDVSPVGPNGSEIGFSAFNTWWHGLTGEIPFWYELTEIFGYIALAAIGLFALYGAYQLITRRSLKKVDTDIYVLGAFYVIVLAFYCLFEVLIINYRPVLVDGILEASYPSSHTMLIICIMSSTRVMLSRRVKSHSLNLTISVVTGAVTTLTVFGRLICGVHWFTDIIGGILLSVFLLTLYDCGNTITENKSNERDS